MNYKTIQDILQAMDAIAPFRLTMDFDNTGLLIGDPDAEVKGVVLALDCTDSVLTEAKEKNANLVITHHPVIFHGIKKVCADSVVWQAVRNDINVISAHTNLDIAQGGVNDCLAEILGLTEVGGLTAVGESVDENGNVSRETFSHPASPADPGADPADRLHQCCHGRAAGEPGGAGAGCAEEQICRGRCCFEATASGSRRSHQCCDRCTDNPCTGSGGRPCGSQE